MELYEIFNKERGQAHKIMMEIHENGQGLARVYTKEQAELRIEMTHSRARARQRSSIIWIATLEGRRNMVGRYSFASHYRGRYN